MSGRRTDALKLNAGETDAAGSLGVAARASDFGSVAGGTSVLGVVGIGLAAGLRVGFLAGRVGFLARSCGLGVEASRWVLGKQGVACGQVFGVLLARLPGVDIGRARSSAGRVWMVGGGSPLQLEGEGQAAREAKRWGPTSYSDTQT